jgi:glycosyltransferase involved in cell wall biosynthesis
VALVHDWLTGMRGGEKVLEGILTLFPESELFTLFHVPGAVSPPIEARPIHTSFIQRVPEAHFRKFLPFFPRAIERFDLSGFELVVSTSHCVAKGVRVPSGVPHVCYCHTPMRYIWTSYEAYVGRGRAPLLARLALAASVGYLRRWDVESARRVSRFVANSENVARRIKRIYAREAIVLRPWVDHAFYTPGDRRGDRYLIVTALVPYKRVEIAIEAFRDLDAELVIAGGGPLLERLSRHAPGNVHFTGRVSDETLRDLYRTARALVFPGEEDFGIVPLEAMACGTPVIAYRAGGALETVVEGTTGTFFDEQTPAALADAVRAFDTTRFDAGRIRAHAERFDRARFLGAFREIVNDTMSESGAARPASARDATG